MYAAIDAKKGEDKQVKEYIDKNVLKENDMINVSSVLDMKASFRRFVGKYYMIGGFLVVILAFIGIMNFFNTTTTSVISRKKELALLEVVGMTKKQISKMLIAEDSYIWEMHLLLQSYWLCLVQKRFYQIRLLRYFSFNCILQSCRACLWFRY